MIKLVASDLDGTILLNGAQHVDDSMCETIDMLGRKGIIFAPASGRQCESLVRLFSKVKSPLMYISDNGALVRYKGETIVKTPMDYNLAIEIAKDIISVPNCEVLLSGEKTAYIMPKTEEYLIRITKVVQYKTTIIKSLDEIQEDILKVSVCDLSGIANSEKYFADKWSDKAAAAVSGDQYMDFMDLCVSKGDALKKVQKIYGIDRSECMAFGDNYNDCEMLKQAEFSYAMASAADDIKKNALYVTDSVEKILRGELL